MASANFFFDKLDRFSEAWSLMINFDPCTYGGEHCNIGYVAIQDLDAILERFDQLKDGQSDDVDQMKGIVRACERSFRHCKLM